MSKGSEWTDLWPIIAVIRLLDVEGGIDLYGASGVDSYLIYSTVILQHTMVHVMYTTVIKYTKITKPKMCTCTNYVILSERWRARYGESILPVTSRKVLFHSRDRMEMTTLFSGFRFPMLHTISKHLAERFSQSCKYTHQCYTHLKTRGRASRYHSVDFTFW